MSRIYHILGANIPHHNQTLLQFFQTALLNELNGEHFFYVVGEPLNPPLPDLAITWFKDKKTIARGIVQQARLDRETFFVLHGQFNWWIWLALFIEKLPPCRCAWHIWGADLYQDSDALVYRLLYPFRRKVQQKLPQLWATAGDLAYAHQHLKRDTQGDKRLYFPTKLPQKQPQSERKHRPLTILLGNSGDRSNRHLAALEQIKQRVTEQVRIIIPMGYPKDNQHYIQQVEQSAWGLFGKAAVEILTEPLAFEDYLGLIAECDLGYFNFQRQQGIGTICLLLQERIPIVLAKENPFVLDLRQNHLPFLLTDSWQQEDLVAVKMQLTSLDLSQVAFFPPQYRQDWLECLNQLRI